MTELLQQAFAKARDLPDNVQDEIAASLLEAMNRKFDDLIDSHPEVLSRLVTEAREDIKAGRVAPLTEADFAIEAD